MSQFRSPIVWRLILWFFLLSLVPVAIVLIFVQRDVQASVLELQARDARSLAHLLADRIVAEPGAMQTIVQEFTAPGRTVFVLGADGTYLAHSDSERVGQKASSDFADPETLDQILSSPELAANVEQTQQLVVSLQRGDIFLVILENTNPTISALQELSGKVTLRLIFSLVITSLVGGAAVLTVLNPLVKLSAFANQLGENLNAPLDKSEFEGEIAALANSLTAMAERLRQSFSNLEQRVADRTHDLELASEVGRTITQKVADLDAMLSEAVELIRARFGLYYTQIYLLDPSRRALVLRAGTGEVGKQLLSRGHRLAVGPGSLNGRAVAENRAIIVADTAESESFLPNPLLPNTRSEMVVPLVIADEVIGVLDMQSEIPGALNETNLPAFTVLAGQLAVALQNARLFAESRQVREELEDNIRRFTEAGWQEFLDGIEHSMSLGYAFDQDKLIELTPEEEDPAPDALHVPITVGGATIGALQVAGENRDWTPDEAEVVQSAARQLGQHIESLRLLARAERYRVEAEEAVRRLTREGWEAYMKARREMGWGYVFDLNKVQPLAEQDGNGSKPALKRSLTVRNEPVGELAVETGAISDETTQILESVAQRLSIHLENLRLSEQNERRAYNLATVAAVSTTASTVLDPDALLQSVVDLAKTRFGLYHAHIYLVDESWNTLMLSAGAGEVGRQLVAQRHAIPLDAERSLVARAARERAAVIVNDVRAEPDFLPNPLLPETRSEMAVPMIVGDKVLGVFDVQSDLLDHFTEEDANIYTTLASQVGVALQNARLYAAQTATVAQLRELDRLKSSFLANMSHELRTPLNSILGFADVILEGLDGPLTENMTTDLKLIQKNGQHLLHLINDVLDMAKIEAGRMNLVVERFSLYEILEEVTSITSPLASEKNLALYIEPDTDKTVEVTADRTRLRQVMLNLVNNAIKFTEQGSIAISARRQDDHVLIRVKDTGIGIAPHQIEAIFQEFVQVDTSTTRKVGGTGLGLPISRRLIEMHGGKLWAESTGVPGEGSTFYVLLPLEARISEPQEKMEK